MFLFLIILIKIILKKIYKYILNSIHWTGGLLLIWKKKVISIDFPIDLDHIFTYLYIVNCSSGLLYLYKNHISV